jgi:hypothetical protein
MIKPQLKEQVSLEFYAPDLVSPFLARGSFQAGDRNFEWTEKPTGEVLIDEDKIVNMLSYEGYQIGEIQAFLTNIRTRIKNAWRNMPQEIKGRALSAYLERV